MSLENPTSILYNSEGYELAVSSSQSITDTQPAIIVAGSGSDGNIRMLQVSDQGAVYVTGALQASVNITDVDQGTKGTPDESWYMVITDGTSSTALGSTGSSPLHVTGDVEVNNTVTVAPEGGSLTIDGTVTAEVTGTVSLDRGNNNTVPLWVTGTLDSQGPEGTASDPVWTTGSVAINEPVTIEGTVTSEVTGTVSLDRGNDSNNPLWVSGSTEVFGTVNVNEPIEVTGSVAVNFNPNPTATVTQVAATTTTTTLAAANTNRRALMIYHDGSKTLFVKLGSGASATDFSVKLVGSGYFEIPGNYTGIVTGIWDNAGGAGNSQAQITEITE